LTRPLLLLLLSLLLLPLGFSFGVPLLEPLRDGSGPWREAVWGVWVGRAGGVSVSLSFLRPKPSQVAFDLTLRIEGSSASPIDCSVVKSDAGSSTESTKELW
jgi:hypothetical protein